MILKGVLPVEDHEFQIVTQIQIFNSNTEKKTYLVAEVPDLPLSRREATLPTPLNRQTGYRGIQSPMLASVSFH